MAGLGFALSDVHQGRLSGLLRIEPGHPTPESRPFISKKVSIAIQQSNKYDVNGKFSVGLKIFIGRRFDLPFSSAFFSYYEGKSNETGRDCHADSSSAPNL